MGTHDADFDFLDSQCDPNDNPDTGKNEDQDGDGTDNFADNCPLVANPDQKDTDKDDIGDACDKNPSEPDGLLDLSMGPQAGDYKFTVFTVAQRDADNDGIQNSMDTCPYVANKGDSTKLNDGDADGDGIDAACDPNDDPISRGTNTDQDADGYLNRQDNCPLVPNGQDSKDQPTGNQHDADFDGIGDVCDTNPDSPDGELISRTLAADIKIGAGGAGGAPTNCPDCFKPGDPPLVIAQKTPPPEEGGGSDTTTYLIIGGAIAAAVVVLGGGATLLLRRGR